MIKRKKNVYKLLVRRKGMKKKWKACYFFHVLFTSEEQKKSFFLMLFSLKVTQMKTK